MRPEEYSQHDATGLAELVAAKEVMAGELLAAARARADAVDPALNAVVRRTDAHADGRLAGDLQGPFAGVPFLLKDLSQELAGEVVSMGSRAFADVRAQETATVVQRWLDAGLVVFGRTNTPEFGAKGITESELLGPARNPWDTTRTPGGSSGGAAAAVAAGIVPCAAASDGGGSIRIPASCCGLFGLKAGRGRLPSGPKASEGLLGSGVDGVISRSVRDTAGMLDVLRGADPAAPYLGAQPERPWAQEVGEDPGRLRIGVRVPTAITPEPHAEARAAVDGAVALLRELGHEVEELPEAPYDDRGLAEDFLTTWFVNCAHLVEQAKQTTGCGDEGFEQDTLLMAALGRATSSVDHLAAIERRHLHVRRLAVFHEQYDLLLTPTTATPPPKVGAFKQPGVVKLLGDVVLKVRGAGLLRRTPVVDQMIDKNLGWVPYTQLANLTGRPAMSVPLHWTADGLPIGVQLVAGLGGEATLLRLASQLEQARPWADRRPALPGA